MAMLKETLVKSTRLTEKLVRRLDRDSGGETSEEEEEVTLEEGAGERRKRKDRGDGGSEEVVGEGVGKRKWQQEESEDEVEAVDSEDDPPSLSSPGCHCVSAQATCLKASCPCSRAGRECGAACHWARPWHTVPCLNTERGRRVGQMDTREMVAILAEADIYVVKERGESEYRSAVAKRLAVHYLSLEEGELQGEEEVR